MKRKSGHHWGFLLSLLFGTLAVSQEEKKPEIANDEAAPASVKKARQVGMLIEYFEVDHRTANKLVREYSPRAADAQELRDTLQEMMERGDATLVETGWLRGYSGQRAKSESIEENIYATHFDPPEIPNIVGGAGRVDTNQKKGDVAVDPNVVDPAADSIDAPVPIHMTAATPTKLETRNVGLTFEVDAVLSQNSSLVHVNGSPRLISRHEDRYYTRPEHEETAWGIDHVYMPTFYRMSLRLLTETIVGNYNLVGLHAPPKKPDKRILCLLKVDVFQH